MATLQQPTSVNMAPILSSQLMEILGDAEIVPGSSPSYQLCKTIYSYHPLGAKMVDAPIDLAQSMPRRLSVRKGPDRQLVAQFQREWFKLGMVGADRLIRNVMRLARIYGISSIIVGTRGDDPDSPLDFWRDASKDLYFNALDPLNTAGALVLNQDPNSPAFLKPTGIRSNGVTYHPSRAVVVLNDDPIYIEWTNSAFGFVGRSVYQRALFPMKSYVQTMITNDIVAKKAALLVAKLKSPGSIVDKIMQGFAVGKRQQINQAAAGNVLQIGVDEDLSSINLLNLEPAARFARDNILKDIATASNMPASMLNNETLASGLADGTEDAKNIARYIDGIRTEMKPVYSYFDRLVMHRAWSRGFYRTIQRQFPEYRNVSYETAFCQWRDSYEYEWPNLLVEPDSELVQRESQIMESAIGVAEIALPILDPANRAEVIGWLAEIVNSRKMLASAPLNIDTEALRDYAAKQDALADAAAEVGVEDVPGDDVGEGEVPGADAKEPETRQAFDA